MNLPFPAGGFGGRCEPHSGVSGAEPRRQTHFGNNLLKSGLKMKLKVKIENGHCE